MPAGDCGRDPGTRKPWFEKASEVERVEVTVNGVMALCEKGGKGGAQVALLPVGSCVQSQPTTVGSVPQKFTLGLNMHNPYLSCHRSLNKCSIVTTYIVFASC